MQATLWLVLGATLGVAALVNYERRQAGQLTLADPVRLGPLRVYVPKGWKVALGDGETPAAVMQAHEPGDGGRVLTVEYQHARELVSPLQHLADNQFTLDPLDPAAPADAEPLELQRLEVAGWPGVMIPDYRPGRSPLAPMAQSPRIMVAAAVLPSRDAVIVRLHGVGPSPHFDQQLLRQVSAAIETEHAPAATALDADVESIDFANGTRLVPPDGFLLVRQNDPNRLSRRLIAEQLPQRWTSLELIPCFFPIHHDGEDLLSILWARDDRWWRGSATQLSPREWQADLPAAADGRFATRAYLTADEFGHALLAVFHGMAADAAAFDAAWEIVARSVNFPSGDPFSDMLQTGIRAGVKMRDQELEDLLKGIADEQWWLWLQVHGPANDDASAASAPKHDSAQPQPQAQQRETYLGWTRLQHYHDPDKWFTRRHSMWRQFDQQVVDLEQSAESPGLLQEHDSTLDLYAAGFTTRPEFKQVVHALPENMTLQLTLHGRRLPPIRMAMPDRYIPGGWFSLLAGRLVSKPMIVQTDAILGYEGLCPPRLLTLLIEPGEPQMIDGVQLRCMNVSINGSGEVSRWYFDATHELQRIEFADGIVRRRSDRNEIASGFAGDRVLGRVGQEGFR